MLLLLGSIVVGWYLVDSVMLGEGDGTVLRLACYCWWTAIG
jgi:hypothetical protein